jgi:hypothetical protein
MKKAYQATINKQKLYFDFSLAGLLAIQKMSKELQTTIKYKCVNVDNDKILID